MAKCHMRVLGLIILCLFFKGTNGVNVFSSSGENVRLPCNNALSDCTTTTWIYNSRHSETVELINGGIKKNNTERHERLSLGSDCSLNIKKVTIEDHGLYTCRQYVNGDQYGTDAPVYLHILHVSSSSSQTQISPGRSVTLYCQLYYLYDRISCDTLVRTEGLQLIWVNEAGVNLMTDSRYQISFSSTQCYSSLTTTLLNEDLNRESRCLVFKNELKTSITTMIPVHTTNSEDPSTTSEFHLQVLSAVAAALAVVLVAGFLIIYKKRADKRRTDSSVVKDVEEHEGTYETINMDIPTPKSNEQVDDVTYSEVTTSNKKQVQKDHDHSHNTVTYAAIRGAENAP